MILALGVLVCMLLFALLRARIGMRVLLLAVGMAMGFIGSEPHHHLLPYEILQGHTDRQDDQDGYEQHQQASSLAQSSSPLRLLCFGVPPLPAASLPEINRRLYRAA